MESETSLAIDTTRKRVCCFDLTSKCRLFQTATNCNLCLDKFLSFLKRFVSNTKVETKEFVSNTKAETKSVPERDNNPNVINSVTYTFYPVGYCLCFLC